MFRHLHLSPRCSIFPTLHFTASAAPLLIWCHNAITKSLRPPILDNSEYKTFYTILPKRLRP
jgi:hypothetical protein